MSARASDGLRIPARNACFSQIEALAIVDSCKTRRGGAENFSIAAGGVTHRDCEREAVAKLVNVTTSSSLSSTRWDRWGRTFAFRSSCHRSYPFAEKRPSTPAEICALPIYEQTKV